MTSHSSDQFVQCHDFDFPAELPDSFTRFQTLVGPIYEVSRLPDDQPFQVRSSIVSLTDILLSWCTSGAARFERSRKAIAHSGIDDIVVLVYLGGSFTFEIDGQVQAVQAGEIAFFDLTLPFAIEARRVDNISLTISRRRLAALTPSVQDIHGFVLREGAARHLLLAHLRASVEIAARIGVSEAAAIGDVALRLVAACCQATARRAAVTARHAGTASLAEIRGFVERHLGRQDLGAAVLMDAFGLSRATLYRFFEPMGGVATYILERRLRRALEVITAPQSTDLRIKQLSHDLGFAHASAFTRAFKKQFGMPPHEVRSQGAYPGPAAGLARDERRAPQARL